MVAAMTAVSCSETDYMTFDTANNGVYFTKDTLNYSFSVTPIEVKTYTYKVPFRIMGPTSGEQRTVKFRVDPQLTTAKEGVQYNLGQAVVLPDSINGYIPVEILRDGLEGTYATGYTKYKLHLILEENEFFQPTLDTASQHRILTFDNAIEQPEWLSAHGEKVHQDGGVFPCTCRHTARDLQKNGGGLRRKPGEHTIRRPVRLSHDIQEVYLRPHV